ncbi:hypothetical protein [Terrabacter sp. 2RAF25]|uniref:hypothetical protein n=1 Tax=Terrabacter sp. 2RAF25 TaxID=3232998 RepID=UPI003F9A876C
MNIDDRLLAEAKLIAARQHRTIGSVLEDALRQLIDADAATPAVRADFQLHTFVPKRPGLRPGVDLEDKELMADLLDGDAHDAPA